MNEWLDLKQIVDSGKYPVSMGTMRSLLAKRKQNGLEKIIRKLGRKIIVRSDQFEKWIESQK